MRTQRARTSSDFTHCRAGPLAGEKAPVFYAHGQIQTVITVTTKRRALPNRAVPKEQGTAWAEGRADDYVNTNSCKKANYPGNPIYCSTVVRNSRCRRSQPTSISGIWAATPTVATAHCKIRLRSITREKKQTQESMNTSVMGGFLER